MFLTFILSEIMKFIKYLLLTLCLFANVTFAANISDEFKNSSKCGVGDNGFVEMWSWDICEQDFSFRVFYRLFPDVMDEHLLKITNPKFLAGDNGATSVKELEKDHLNIYRSYQYTLMNMFKNMFDLAFFFGVILFVWHSTLALIRATTEGGILGERYSLGGTLIKYGIILVGFLPLGGGLMVIHVVVFLLIMFGIAFANLLYGVYINFMDIGTNDIDANQTLVDQQQFDPYNADDYYSAEIVKSMFKMSMCKTVTEQFMFENNITQSTYKNWSNVQNCSAEKMTQGQIYNENMSGDNIVKNGSAINFIPAKTNNFTSEKGELYLSGGVLIGRNIQNSSSCDGIVGISNYTCGSITVSPPSLSNSKVLDLLKDINFFNYYASASKEINELSGSTSDNVKSIASKNWDLIKAAAVAKLSPTGSIDNLSPEDEIIIKNVAYYYHKLLLNDSIVGGLGFIKGENSLLNNTNNENLFSKTAELSVATGLALEKHCTAHQELRNKSKNLIDYLNGEDVKDKSFSAACVLITPSGELSILGKDNAGSDKNAQDNLTEATNSSGSDVDNQRSSDALKSLITDLTTKRKGIKSSLFQSVKGMDDKNISQQMRKLGWASAGGYMLRLIKNTEADSRLMTAFDQSVSVDISNISPQMIGKTYQTQKDSANNDFDNANFLDLEQTYKTIVAPYISKRSDLRVLDVSALSESVVNDLTLQKEKDEHLSTLLLETIMNPFGDFKRMIGNGVDGDMLTASTVQECINDMSKCNFSFNNPMSSITDFGNNLIKVSSTMIIATASVAMLRAASLYISNKDLREQISNSGTISKAAGDVNGLGESLASKLGGNAAGFVYTVANYLAESKVLSAIYLFLSLLINVFFVLLLMGVWFAYILPLIPFMTFLFAFLSWITLCLIALFVAPMWLAFNIQMTEKDKNMTDMLQSALSIGLQILFRPALTIIAFVIGWSLFTIAFAVISLTSMPFLSSVIIGGSDFSVTRLIDNIFIVGAYGVMLFVGIRYVFTITHGLANKMFQALNVVTMDEGTNSYIEQTTQTAMLSMLNKFNVMQDLGNNIDQTINKLDNTRDKLSRESNNRSEIRTKLGDFNREKGIQDNNENDN